jgi:hypothetical protein
MGWLKARWSSARAWIWSYTKWGSLALIAAGIILALWKVPEWQVRGYHGRLDAGAITKLTPQELIQLQKELITAENNARVTIAQILGGFGLLVGLYLTYRNVKIAHKNVEVAEEGKLTDRFSKAVELLGSEKLDVRLGGIYALERIARDSQKDHWTVMEVLTAFVREQSPKEVVQYTNFLNFYEGYAENPGILPKDAPVYKYPADIQAALTVIGRRKWFEQEKPHQRIDLGSSFLAGADLSGAILRGALLNNTNLSGANLDSTDLTGANLTLADLSRAILSRARLIRANLLMADLVFTHLFEADLADAFLSSARLINANLFAANLTNATFNADTNLTGANLSATSGLTWEQISKASIAETTMLPPELEERRKTGQSKKTG